MESNMESNMEKNNTIHRQLKTRQLMQVINAQSAHDGDGVKISRIAGQAYHQLLNPFLMIDEINSDDAVDYIGGFPSHPHRGFETITYMKAGRMRHKDHLGNDGLISSGDVQWMTAGKGVIHSEMPEQENGLLHGFQLWLNLPANEKMKPAAYRELKQSSLPRLVLSGGGEIVAVAGNVIVLNKKGELKSIHGPLPQMTTNPVFLDLKLIPNETTTLELNVNNNAWVYVYEGSTTQLKHKQLGYYASGDILTLTASSQGMSALILSGEGINEPVVQYGPFVMNSREEINQAIDDYQNNCLV